MCINARFQVKKIPLACFAGYGLPKPAQRPALAAGQYARSLL